VIVLLAGIWLGAHPSDLPSPLRASFLQAGLGTGAAKIGADLDARETQLEDVDKGAADDRQRRFSALAAYELRGELGSGRVFRLAPGPRLLQMAPASAEGGILFDRDLTYRELSRRLEAGARVEATPASSATLANGATALFALRADGELRVITSRAGPEVKAGDRLICLTAGG